MTILDDSALEFARAHIEKFYDSDFFPKSDEYEVLWSRWEDVKTHLRSLNVSKLGAQRPRAMPAPKARGGYRMVHQLHPVDALAYTALAISTSPAIEAKRPSEQARSVFSYRIKPTANNFFGQGNGYGAFIERCKELCVKHRFVFVADIADFYNRIYTHRVNNNICYADSGLEGIAADVEVLLSQFNQKTSQGIPVGPAASIVFSEALLLDVDERIGEAGIEHCRYVDDMRMFADDRAQLERLEEELVDYLFDFHRLQFAPGKTKILDSASFLATLEPPEAFERRELLDAARPICDYGDAFTVDDVDELAKKFLDAETRQASVANQSAISGIAAVLETIRRQEEFERDLIRTNVLESLFALGTDRESVDLGLVRHSLRRARRWKNATLVGAVFRKFEQLGPVIPDVMLYLHEVMTSDLRLKHAKELESLSQGGLFAKSRFVRHWIYWFVSSFADLVEHNVSLLKRGPIEFQARAAAVGRKFHWLRGLKDIASYGAWDRRAVLLAWRVMPKDERMWLNSFVPSEPTEKWIVEWVRKQP